MSTDFVPMREAAKRLGMTTFALRRRIARGDLAVYSSPADLRQRLIRISDLELYAQPRPITNRTERGPLPAA